ncbi:MAG: alpha/beta hydrolase [Oscillospiraceae bacterium]|nr:alpha/beta hydrolase [Oscillospiraceae bacterium]
MIRVKKIQIPQLPTKDGRRLYVYLPRDYAGSEERYPVLYMFDGHNVFYDSHATYGKSWGMKAYLEKTKLPLILVAVECNTEGTRRLNEYTPWTFSRRGLGTIEALGRATMDWFVDDLKPEIDRTYRTLPDRAHTLIAGSSMGGLMSLYAVVQYNAVFSRAAALSPSLWVDPKALAELIRSRDLRSPTSIYMDMGSGEVAGHRHALSGMFDVAKLLTKSGADVAARVVPGAMHCEAAWEERIPVFFQYLLG